MTQSSALFLGVDFGTSGVRAIAIDSAGLIVSEKKIDLDAPHQHDGKHEQAPEMWWRGLIKVLALIRQDIDFNRIDSLAIDGTSGTLLLADNNGQPLGPALMYNDGRSTNEAQRISQIAPQESAAHGASSALAKLLYLQARHQARYALHQADWIIGKLTDRWGLSDTNNSLKLGYDALSKRWPDWLTRLDINLKCLPHVHNPGTRIGHVSTTICQQFGFKSDTQVIAGTTDSTAAIIATGASRPGQAVTSLGSTLVMKVISETPIFSPEHGVYSQPLGDYWLVGGASNSGGAVLRHYFSDAQMAAMTPRLKINQPTELDYYPLLSPGERFPICDPNLAPRLSPRPDSDETFFQAMLEAMTRIEQRGYDLLAQLGAPYPSSVRSAGGGAKNPVWTQMREQALGVTMLTATHQEAAYGAALLAQRGMSSSVNLAIQ